ncbi:MAG: hypothetical protein LN415_05665 [Candidatus Thermoplasmatota archaeon]|nr:hypothetical protein [Candidatus Thermoplasmatota archaeon]
MDIPFILSAIIVGIPAFVIVFHALRNYDYPVVEESLFDFQKVFFTLIIGFVFGTVANILRLSLPSELDPVWILFLSLMGMAVVEESFKTIFLNMKRFSLKFDTTFYGLSLSVGIAAAMAFFDNYVTLRFTDPVHDALTLFSLSLLSIGIIALHVSTGSVIGYGSSKGDVFPSLLQAIVYRSLYVLLILPFILIPMYPDFIWLGFAFLIASVLYALLLYWRAYNLILPVSLPDDLKKKKSRKARRKRLTENREK